MTDIGQLINEQARGLAFRRAAEVEAKLLAGCNRLVVEDEFAGMTMGRTVYEVPRWRDRPVVRFKIERMRRAYRRKVAGAGR